MSVTLMDSMSMFIVQTLGLQLMRHERPLLIRLSLTRLLFFFSQKAFGLNLARIRLSLKRLLLIGLISLTLEFYWEFLVDYVLDIHVISPYFGGISLYFANFTENLPI